MSAELILEIIDVSGLSDYDVGSVTLRTSAVKFHAVNTADIVNVDGIALLYLAVKIHGICFIII